MLPGPEWHILLPPHAAPDRIYLARAQCQRHYRREQTIDAPAEPPETLLATWQCADTPLRFVHVASPEQLSLVMHYSTADQHIYLPPGAPLHATANLYTAASPT